VKILLNDQKLYLCFPLRLVLLNIKSCPRKM
jgi:hypothetical protein